MGTNALICISEGMYGAIKLPPEIFDKLNPEYFISSSTDGIKYMCANDKEKAHLKSLGVDMQMICCDWFKIYRINTGE